LWLGLHSRPLAHHQSALLPLRHAEVQVNPHLRATLRDIALTDPAVSIDPGFLRAKAAADGLFPPMSPAERAEFNSLRAAEMARAEQRRLPQPQLELV
jgi:hypothetical protein